MRAAVLFMLVTSCTWQYDANELPDAAAPDAYQYMPPPQISCAGAPEIGSASCMTGSASTNVYRYFSMGGTHSMCFEQLQKDSAQCSAGCAIETSLMLGSPDVAEIEYFGSAAHVLCAETPEPHIGDACSTTGPAPCLPTRAQVASDGTVTGQSYLACVSGTCQAAAAPPVANYLQACDSQTLATYGMEGVNGTIAYGGKIACLLAWDEASQSVKSGVTRWCVGDWQCPSGSLCDDEVFPAGNTMRAAVCKPGPRGVLTPAMLSP